MIRGYTSAALFLLLWSASLYVFYLIVRNICFSSFLLYINTHKYDCTMYIYVHSPRETRIHRNNKIEFLEQTITYKPTPAKNIKTLFKAH